MYEERDKITKIKNTYYDLLTAVANNCDLKETLLMALKAIKNIFEVENVNYYHYNPLNKNDYDLLATTKQGLNFNNFQSVKGNDYTYIKYNDQDTVILPLSDSGTNRIGFLVLIGISNQYAYLFQELQEITSRFIYAIDANSILDDKIKQYKKLVKVTERFHSSINLNEVLAEIIASLTEIFPEYELRLLLSHEFNVDPSLPISNLEHESDNQAMTQAFMKGEIQIDDSILLKHSVLFAPLKGKQGVYGLLKIVAPHSLFLYQAEINLIQLLAKTAGSAIENAQLFLQSNRLIADLQLINETSQTLNENLRLTDTLTLLSNRLVSTFGAQEVGILLFSNDQTQILDGSTTFFKKEEAKGLISMVRQHVDDKADYLFVGNVLHKGINIDYRSLVAIPMVQHNTFKGVVIILHEQEYAFAFEAFKLMQALIRHSALAFANSILREKLEEMVVVDYLTKLHTRSYLDDKVQKATERDGCGSLLLMDIDDFKLVNDTYGHQIGDEVLVQVADVIRANIRENDVGARWGGEELAVYLSNVDLSTAVKIAERLVENVYLHTKPRVTISCGIASWDGQKRSSLKSLIKRADRSLYKAKSSGKNKVVQES